MYVRTITEHKGVPLGTTGIVNRLLYLISKSDKVTLNLDCLNSKNLSFRNLTDRKVKKFPIEYLVVITEEEYLAARDLTGPEFRELHKKKITSLTEQA